MSFSFSNSAGFIVLNVNWKGSGRKQSWHILRSYPVIYLKGLRKIMKYLSQDRQSPSQNMNPGLPKYKAGVLTTQLQLSVL
jgi:hypothetical protein